MFYWVGAAEGVPRVLFTAAALSNQGREREITEGKERQRDKEIWIDEKDNGRERGMEKEGNRERERQREIKRKRKKRERAYVTRTIDNIQFQ